MESYPTEDEQYETNPSEFSTINSSHSVCIIANIIRFQKKLRTFLEFRQTNAKHLDFCLKI